MSITQYSASSTLATPTSKITTVTKSASGELALLKEQARFGGLVANGAQQMYEREGRAKLMQAVNEYNAAMSLETDKLHQLKEGNAASNVDNYNTIAAKTKDKIAKKYSFLGNGQYADEFNRMTFQSAVQGRNSMMQYVNAETEKHIATEDNLSLQNQYKTVADNAGDDITMNMQKQILKERINLLYPQHDDAFREVKYRKDVTGMVKSSLDASLAVNDYATAERTLVVYENDLPANITTQYKKVIQGRVQMNHDLEYMDGITKKYGSYAEFEKAVNDGKESIPGVKQGGDMPVLETRIQDGIEDAGLAKTNPTLRKGVDALNAWVNGEFGAELTISGGWRSEKHNAEVNGAKNSHHLHGNALDVVIPESFSEKELQAIKDKAIEMGFNSDGEDMYHDKGSGYHLHLTLPNGIKGNTAKVDLVRKKDLMRKAEAAFAHKRQQEKLAENQRIEQMMDSVYGWHSNGISYADAYREAERLCGSDRKALQQMYGEIDFWYNPHNVPMSQEQATKLNAMIIDGASQADILKYCKEQRIKATSAMAAIKKNSQAAKKQGVYSADLKGVKAELKEKLEAVTGAKPSEAMLNSAMRIVTQYAENEQIKNGALPSRYDLVERGVKSAITPVASGLTYNGNGQDFKKLKDGGWFGSDEFGYTESDYERKGIEPPTKMIDGDRTLWVVTSLNGQQRIKTTEELQKYMEE